jgi:hypothetical protein
MTVGEGFGFEGIVVGRVARQHSISRPSVNERRERR